MTLNTSHVVATGACIAACGVVLLAGPLDPPDGPIRSTQLTLDTIEPRTPLTSAFVQGDETSMFRITESGHYYLTERLTVDEGKTGIVVDANFVTVDLNGYLIIGDNGSLDGIAQSHRAAGTTIRNGSIDAQRAGIRFADNSARNRVENLQIAEAEEVGIRGGHDVVIRDSLIRSARRGIFLRDRARVENCTIIASTEGVRTGLRSIVRNNMIEPSVLGSLDAIITREGSIIESNTVLTGNDSGINAPDSVVRNNTLDGRGSTQAGLIATGITTGNVVRGFRTNIAQDGGIVSGNHVIDASDTGIDVTDALALDNTVIVTGDTGILARGYVTLRGNVVTEQENLSPAAGDTTGIFSFSDYKVLDNNTVSRVTLGIRGTGSGSITRNNTVFDSERGFQFTSLRGHAIGPIETFDFSADVIKSDSPYANFEFLPRTFP